MKLIKILLLVVFFFSAVSVSIAASVRIAGEDDIKLLKSDFLHGKISIGGTRLKKVKSAYGDPVEIKDSEKAITYAYGDISLDFEKVRLWRGWKYDYSHPRAYTDDIDGLREDLEGENIVGDYLTLKEFRKDYGEPTEAYEKFEDGDISVYFWGEIRLTFENVYTLKSVKGKNLEVTGAEGVLTGSVAEPVTEDVKE